MGDSFHALNRAYYERNAARYERASWYTFNRYKSREVERELRACWRAIEASGTDPPGSSTRAVSMLEIGPGTGYLLDRLRAIAPAAPVHWTGIEHSQAMATILRGRHAGWLESIEIVSDSVRSGVAARAANGRTFDLVAGSSVLHHLPDYETVVHELAGIVRPGGCLYFVREPIHEDDCRPAGPAARALEKVFAGATSLMLKPAVRRLVYPKKVQAEDARDVAIHLFGAGVSLDPFRKLETDGFERIALRRYNRRLTWLLSSLENRWLSGLRADVLGNTMFAVALHRAVRS